MNYASSSGASMDFNLANIIFEVGKFFAQEYYVRSVDQPYLRNRDSYAALSENSKSGKTSDQHFKLVFFRLKYDFDIKDCTCFNRISIVSVI